MLSFTIHQLNHFIGIFWWPFCRLMGAFSIMPFLGHAFVPSRIRIVLAASIAGLIGSIMPEHEIIEILSLGSFFITIEEIFIGFIMGLSLLMMYHILSILGTVISSQMGLSMATMNDPGSGANVPLVGQIFTMYGTLLFLSLNGHLVAINVFVDSFTLWPVGHGILNLPLMQFLKLFTWMISSALSLALPAIIAMLVVNLTFGVLNRSTPSLNIYSLGFPMSLIMGLVCILLSFVGLPSHYSQFCQQALSNIPLLFS